MQVEVYVCHHPPLKERLDGLWRRLCQERLNDRATILDGPQPEAFPVRAELIARNLSLAAKHRLAWQRIACLEAVGLVLEDDVLCDAFVLDRICDAVASLRGTPWDVLLVGYAETPRSGLRAVGLSVAKIDDFIGTHCYVVSRGGALKLAGRGLPDKYPITQHIDAQLSAWTRAGVIDVYACTESFAMSALHSGQDHGPVE